ncbi:GNAT family N-acetyltransferase [Pseudonocardia spinosispora]|uniref:GNAT family N-acetyltransferase n=1 Tax=Pseudonocardia spinosispora TaxID=103441 RepID=UPI000A0065BF
MSSDTPSCSTSSAPDVSDVLDAFFSLHDGLPRQAPGSDATTGTLLSLVGGLPADPRVLDIGCGSGRASLVLAEALTANVTAVDTHEPILDELRRAAERSGLSSRVNAAALSMTELPFDAGSFDLIWAEGSAYIMGFDAALREWRRLLAPGGTLVITECEWSHSHPSTEAREFWAEAYPLRTTAENVGAADAAGYTVAATYRLPDRDWFDEYYTPLDQRIAQLTTVTDSMAKAVAVTRREIDMRCEHGTDYSYTGYVLTPRPDHEDGEETTMSDTTTRISWATRPETPGDIEAIRAVNLAAFDTAGEADLIEALRQDPAWLPGLSWVAQAPDGRVAGYALLTRSWVGGENALTLGPVAVLPEYQKLGAGGAVIRALIDEARTRGERLIVVLGHAEYYPRFGFTRASGHGISVTFDVPDETLMALPLDESVPVPSGTIRYPAPFGV